MLYDFSKLKTFMVVVKEKSFSKASMKMGISQPAVTQQIKYLESYFNTKIVIRKKSGIGLTKEGERLFATAQKIEKSLNTHQKEFMRNIKYQGPLVFSCSYTIGNFIFPKVLPNLLEDFYPDIQHYTTTSLQAIKDLQSKKSNIALIESPIFKSGIVYREWLEDEIVLVSTKKLPQVIKRDDLYNYQWVNLSLGTKNFMAIKNYLEKLEVSMDKLDVVATFETYLQVKEFLLQESLKNNYYMAFLPYLYIKDELQEKKFFYTKVLGLKLKRKLYLALLRENRNHSLIENISDYLIFNTKVNVY